MPSTIKPIDNNSPDYMLPFSIDEQSFQQWIDNLDLNHEIESLESLSSTLQALNHILMPPKTRYFFLHKIATLIEKFFQQLQLNYKNSFFPFSEIETQKIELSTLCSLEIVNICALFCNDRTINNNKTFTEQQLALIIYRGIYFQTQVIFFKSMLYKNFEQGFWHVSFMFYLYAKQNNILDLKLKNQTACFINTFKHLLVFELSNPHCLNTDEIIAVFQLLKNLSSKVEIISRTPEKQLKNIPFIDLISDAPPSFLNNDDSQVQTYHYYISSLKIIKNLHQLSLKKTNPADYTKTFLEKLINTLRFNQQRSNERNQITDQIDIVTGFDKIINFLQTIPESGYSAPKKNQELQFNFNIDEKNYSESTENIRSVSQAHTAFTSQNENNVAPLENLKKIESTDIWNTIESEPEPQKTTHKNISATVKLFDKSETGFRISIIDTNVATKVGDLIGIINEDVIVITIVRRILQIDRHESHFGVELLGNNVDFLKLINTGNESATMGIYLKNSDAVRNIILKSSVFQNEAFLFSNNNDKIVRHQVESQINLSPTLTLLTVSSS